MHCYPLRVVEVDLGQLQINSQNGYAAYRQAAEAATTNPRVVLSENSTNRSVSIPIITLRQCSTDVVLHVLSSISTRPERFNV